MRDTAEKALELLNGRFAPDPIDIKDDSHRHAGHAGNRGGAHLTVTITSAAFTGLSRIERHRLIHEALAPLMEHEIHALAIKASAPGE